MESVVWRSEVSSEMEGQSVRTHLLQVSTVNDTAHAGKGEEPVQVAVQVLTYRSRP